MKSTALKRSLLAVAVISICRAQTVSGPPAPLLTSLDTVVLNLMSKWQIPGAALGITKDGRLVLAHGYGYADTSTLQPVQPDSLFRIASISKPLITATAILKLIEQGKLQLTTLAFSVLSDLTPPPGATVDPRIYQITIQNLLEHKGGWDRSMAGDPPFIYADTAATAFGAQPPATPDQLIRYMMGKPLQFNPGTTSAYSNFGYIVLGAIIERVSGQTYSDFVRSQILTPLGISRLQPGASLLSGRAAGEVKYYDYPGARLTSSVFPPFGLVPAPYGGFSLELMLANGGWIASTMELLRIADTLNGQLTPSLLQSPPAGFVGYVPPVGAGWGWVFDGSLEGTSTIIHLDTGYQVNGKVTYALLFNTRQAGSPSPDILADADGQMLSAVQAIQSWPSGDLFATFSETAPGPPPPIKFSNQEVTTTAPPASGCSTPPALTSFLTTDGTVYLYFNATVSGSDHITADWLAPNGDVLPANDWGTLAAGSYCFVGAALDISNPKPGHFGAWQARVYDNGTQLFAVPFTISAAGPSPGSSSALQFLSVAPCRILDTRNANGTFGGPYLAANSSRVIPIPSSGCNVPGNAAAYSLNITVVPRAPRLGSLTLWPSGSPQPNVSTLTSPDAQVLANAAIVPASASGAITASSTDDTDLVVDINGYFVPPSSNTVQFFPMPPCRILDTRLPNGVFGGPAIAGGSFRSFPVPLSGCNVPSNAAAYSFNVTIVPHGPLGYLTAWPAGQSQPFVSTINSWDGTILANAAIVPAGSGGAVDFYASNTTDLVIDINGYFAPPGSGGLNFYTVAPCRAVDTRGANGPLGGPIVGGGSTRTFPLSQSACQLPNYPAAQAYSLTTTVFPQGPLSYITMWPAGSTQPFVSTLNAFKGLPVANAAIAPAGSGGGGVSVFVTNTTNLTIDTAGYFGP